MDGNKRIGTHAMLTLLVFNGIEISCTQKELAGIMRDVTAGKTDYDGMLGWLWIIRNELPSSFPS